MTIDEAIKILERETHNYPQKGTDNCVDAIKLGIQALKRIQDYRFHYMLSKQNLLPGETEPV